MSQQTLNARKTLAKYIVFFSLFAASFIINSFVSSSNQNAPIIVTEKPVAKKLAPLGISHKNPTSIKQYMTVAQAYAATNVVFTPFNTHKTKNMVFEEANYIKSLFDLVNIGVIERVTMMQNLNNPALRKSISRNHEEILRRIDSLSPPATLEDVHLLILHAVNEEKMYFDTLLESPARKFDVSAPLVVSADQKLRAAYDILMDRYADENEEIKRSFYSQLCALSFI